MKNVQLLRQYKPFATEHHRYKVAYSGRGSGKTWQYAQILLLKARDFPLRILCTREFQNSIEESVYHTLTSQITRLGLDGFTVHNNEITSSAGAQFIFKGLRHNIDSIKSMEDVDICWVAEADKVPQDSWDKLIPTIRKPGSEIWVDFNTDSTEDPVYRMFIAQQRPDTIVLFQTFLDNKFFPDTLVHEMEFCKANDYEKYLWIWEGQPRQISDACIFKGKFRVDDFKTPDNAEFVHGVDWGFANDPLAGIRAFVQDDKLFIDAECGGVGIDINRTATTLNQIPTMASWVSRADNARPELISHMQQNGFPRMRSCHKGKGSVEDGIAKIRGFAEIVIHQRCENVIQEFKLYKWKTNSTNGDIMPIPEDKHNHWVDALRYALEDYERQSYSMVRY